MTLKSIKLTNVQSHRNTFIELPEFGIIQFNGPNSNGKSVIRKIIQKTIHYDITKPDVRRGLIHWDCNWCEAELVRYDEMKLTIHIDVESSQTWVSLQSPGKEEIKRYIADKNIPTLINRFGYHTMSHNSLDFSLNITDPDDAKTFFRTPHSMNLEIIKTAMTDSNADKAAEEFERTIKEAKKIKGEFQKQIDVNQAALSTLEICDVVAESEKVSLMEHYLSILELCEPPQPFPEILPVPNVEFIDIPEVHLPEIKWPVIVDTSFEIPDISEMVEELDALREGVCPTCHRKFYS